MICLPANEEIGLGDEFIFKQIKTKVPIFVVVTKIDLISKLELAVKLTKVNELIQQLKINQVEIIPLS